jgi:hypothetical protein
MNGNVTILIIPFNKNNPTTRGEYRRESCYSDRKFKRIRVQLYYAIDIQFRKIAWNQNWILRLTVPSEWDFLAGKSDTENHCKYRKIYEKESISWLPTPSNEWERKSKIFMHIKSYIIILFLHAFDHLRSRDKSVGIATGYELDNRWVGVRVKNFFSPLRPDRLWGPASLLSNEYRGLFPQG